MNDRTVRVLAWGLFGAIVVGFLVRAALNVATTGRSDLEAGLGFDALLLTFPAVGVVLASKRPRNRLGWLMLAIGAGFIAPGAPYARYAVERGGDLPGVGLAIAIDSPLWVVFIGLSGFLLMLFPDGRLPSPRWRWFGWTCGVGLTLLFLAILLHPDQGADVGLPQIENPLAVPFVERVDGLLYVFLVSAPMTVVGGAVAIIGRLRRTPDPVERRQLRWLAWAAGVIAFAYLMAFLPGLFGVPDDSRWSNVLASVSVLTFMLIPVTIGIAVLRYRLYDIDFVIRKTVVFATLAAFIAAVYVGLVVGVGALVGSRGSPVLSAVAAAVVALVFQPVRARARRLADRLVFGRRATPYELLTSFGEHLAETYSVDEVLPRIARVLAEGVGAERARIWLRVDDQLRVVATWPPDARDTGQDDVITEVHHKGESLGALSVSMPANDPLDPAKERLVRDLAGHAGLVMSNVRLTEELRARLDDLRAAQKRLVGAQDQERRRIERNIHDGAQQQLVALTVKARLARQLAERDAARAAEMLAQIEAETQIALEDLRDLARGIYPPLLADKGLTAALEAQARKSPVPVEIDADGIDRLPQDVEGAVYFSVLEALQNVAKYANATHATVRMRRNGDGLTFAVRDDGRGFDAAHVGHGTGLQGMADRLAALDGRLEVESEPGAGTVVAGRIPLEGG